MDTITADIDAAKARLDLAEKNCDRDLTLECVKLLNNLLQKENNVLPGSSVELIENVVRRILNEQKKDVINFSTCSQETLRTFLTSLSIDVDIEDELDCLNSSIEFQAFDWKQQEDEDIKRAKEHIEMQLQKFGVKFGRNGYQLYDVHAIKDILNVDDPKIGKSLRGSTDLIIGPYGKHLMSVAQQSCVAIELKTNESVQKNGFGQSFAQGTLQLIAANYLSNQLSVVLLTDLHSNTTIFTLRQAENNVISVVAYEKLTLNQAGKFIANHLARDCVPIKNHRLENGKRKADEFLRAFKKNRMSRLEDSLAWEHFQDMVTDCPEFSRERAEVIKQLFTSSDLPVPSIINMFS